MPHIFMQQAILPRVIFSPGHLALNMAEGLGKLGHAVTLFTPGPVETSAQNVTADLSYFERELDLRGNDYLDLLKKHPLTFITLARQVQAELIAKAYQAANDNQLDIVHMYGNEEDIALPFAAFCSKPVVFTHHDPFNFLATYNSIFPKYAHLNWISLSHAQRKTMPATTNWVGNIYHGLPKDEFAMSANPRGDYVAFLGRLIQPKGAHLAIKAVQAYNTLHPDKPLKLRLAGKHYSGTSKDSYWQQHIEPALADPNIEYIGHIKQTSAKQEFLGNARALIIPSLFEEPFGMVMIEALACGTPILGLDSGAIPEVITHKKTGILVQKAAQEDDTVAALAHAIPMVGTISRAACRQEFEDRFTLERMCKEHVAVYATLTK